MADTTQDTGTKDLTQQEAQELGQKVETLLEQTVRLREETEQLIVERDTYRAASEGMWEILARAQAVPPKERRQLVREGLQLMLSKGMFPGTHTSLLDPMRAKYGLVY